MKTSLLLLIAIITVENGWHFAYANSQKPSPQDILSKPVGPITFDSTEPVNAFTAALKAANLPGGVIKIEAPSSLKKTITAGPSVGEALRSIIAIAPQYRWSLENDVINLMPTAGEPSLLSFRIKQFDIDSAISLQSALNKLLTQPELKKRVDELGLNTGLQIMVGPVNAPGQQSKTITDVHCSNATIREVLNALVHAHGTAIWEYRETHWKGHNGFSVMFLKQ